MLGGNFNRLILQNCDGKNFGGPSTAAKHDVTRS